MLNYWSDFVFVGLVCSVVDRQGQCFACLCVVQHDLHYIHPKKSTQIPYVMSEKVEDLYAADYAEEYGE